MKIAEYIELVKQAETINFDGTSTSPSTQSPLNFTVVENGQTTTPFVASSSTPLGTPELYDTEVPTKLPKATEVIPALREPQYERPRINPENGLPYRNPKTGLINTKKPFEFLQTKTPEGELRFGVNIPKPKFTPIEAQNIALLEGFNADRTWPEWGRDFFRRGAWEDWWSTNPIKRTIAAHADLVNGQLNQELSFKPKFHGMDAGFSVAIPLVHGGGTHHIKDKTIQDSNKYNLGPTTTALDYFLVRTPEELARQTPNVAGEYINFGVSPLAPVNMATMLANMALPKHYQLPSFYTMHHEDNRWRTGEYKKDYSKYDPDLQEKQDKIYQNPNLAADYVGAVVDPFLKWLPGYENGFGLGLKQRSDGEGIDYQAALKPVFGSESWDTIHGMREGYSEEDIQGLFNKAIANGFTPDEANAAEAYFRNANSKYGNALLMMAMSPEDLYNSDWVLDTIKDSTPDKSIPEYLPAPPVGFAGPSLYVPKKNPAWLKEQLRRQKIINDQQVFKELYPFYRDIVGTGKTMSDEESKFLDSMLSLPDEGVKEWLAQQERPNITSENPKEILREISSLPYPLRYALMAHIPYIYDPKDTANFVGRYYHPKDREKVLKVLRRLSSIK